MRRTLIILLLACASSASAAQFKFGTQTLTVPDGFEVECVAAPPLVNRPINFSFDDQGRLYVTDSAGMSDKPQKQLETKPHRVLRLDAAGADGKFTKSDVFADKMMFPEGCLWHDGSLYVAAPPQIWKFNSKGERSVWYDGKTLTGCANDLHGPYLGRDGWIYFCKGAFAEQTITLPNGKPFVTRAAHIFRARPDGTGIEPVLTGGMDNPVGVAFNSVGERFLSCTFFQNPAGGKRDGLIHAIYGGVYGKIHDVLNGHKMTGGVMPVLTNWGAAAPCGITCYDSTIFGPDYRDNLFTCCFNLHKVIRTILVPDGATYTAQDSDFLVSDSPDFHPTDVTEDADGSLLVADTGGWYKICCPTSQLAKPDVLGAIYRIRKVGAKVLEDPRGLKIDWRKLKDKELASFLGDARHLVRKRAMDVLANSASDYAAFALIEVADKSTDAEARRNALWTLGRLYTLIPPFKRHFEWILDKDPSVAHVAIHVTSLNRQSDATKALIELVEKSENTALKRVAAEALGRVGGKMACDSLSHAAYVEHPGGPTASGAPEKVSERILEHSVLYALIEIGDAEFLRSMPIPPHAPQLERISLVARDQMEPCDLKASEVVRCLSSSDPTVKSTASWIITHHPEWGDALLEHYTNRLKATEFKDDDKSDIARGLASLANAPKIQALIAQSASDFQHADVQSIGLRAMAESHLKNAPLEWINALDLALRTAGESKDVEKLLARIIETARVLPPPPKGVVGLEVPLVFLARDTKLPDELRINALATASRHLTVDPQMFDLLVANLALSKPASIRSAAASVLGSADLTDAQRLALVDAIKTDIGPLELRQLLPVFEHGANDALGMKLFDTLKNLKNARGLRAEILRPIFAKYSKAVQSAVAGWLAELNPNAAAQGAHLDELSKTLPKGDVSRGHLVFQNAKTACTTCHAMGYLGGTLGPDLTHVGQVRTERDLLESIVYPSASFVRSYEPFTVKTKSGEHFSGILKKDAPDEIVLALDAKSEKRIPRAEIDRLELSTVSIMPDGFETLLTPQDLADLIAFLKTAK